MIFDPKRFAQDPYLYALESLVEDGRLVRTAWTTPDGSAVYVSPETYDPQIHDVPRVCSPEEEAP